MQVFRQAKPPVGVIFDCALGTDIADVLALALLYGFDGKNEARVIAVSTSAHNLKSAALAEVIGRFYAGSATGPPSPFSRTLAVGMAADGKFTADTPMLLAPLDRKTPEGKRLYNHSIGQLTDTAEPAAFLRNALTAQHDENAIVIGTGPASNLAGLLALAGAKQWIEKKVRYLVYYADDRLSADVPAAKKLFAEWPGDIVLSTPEAGGGFFYPGASIEKDFAWTETHPVADAYKANRSMPYDAPSGAMNAVLHAIKPQENYYKLSAGGTIAIDDAGRPRLAPGATGRHRQLLADHDQKDKILAVFTTLASAKPVPRVQRFRPQQQQNVPPVKPEAAKVESSKP